MASMLFDHGARLMPRLTPMDTGLFLREFLKKKTPTAALNIFAYYLFIFQNLL